MKKIRVLYIEDDAIATEEGEIRRKKTDNHVKRAASYSKLLATKYGLDKEDINTMYQD